MTRINSAIPPQNLTDQHLLAELRELPRIFTAVSKRIEQGKGFDDIPNKFTLGTGHCKFFYDKCEFLIDRHIKLRYEYQTRFIKQYDFDPNRYRVYFKEDKQFYKSTQEERELLIDRISTRITESKQVPRYCGQSITKERAIEILKS